MPLNLTQPEIEEITGKKQQAAQLRWLQSHGFTAMRNAAGEVIVSRAHYERVMGGAPTERRDTRPKPNFAALHGSEKAA